MTSQFWKWLSRANGRAALLAGAVALLAALAYWIWRELEPAQEHPVYPGLMTESDSGLTNKVELLAFLQSQQKNGEKAMNNPFYRKPAFRPDVRPDVKPDVKPPPKPDVKPPPKPDVKPPPPPPPPPKKVTPVIFRGVMTRPDGARVALIENQETKKQRFFEAGQSFLDGTVEGLGTESVTLKRGGGEVVLPFGKVVRIQEQ